MRSPLAYRQPWPDDSHSKAQLTRQTIAAREGSHLMRKRWLGLMRMRLPQRAARAGDSVNETNTEITLAGAMVMENCW